MQFGFSSQKPLELKVDALVVNIFEGKDNVSDQIKILDEPLDGVVSEIMKSGEVKGKLFDSALIHTHNKIPAKKLLLIGSGKKEEFSSDKFSQMIGAAFRKLSQKGNKSIAFFLSSGPEPLTKLALGVEAVISASFDPAIYKSPEEEKQEIKEVTFADPNLKSGEATQEAIAQGEIVGGAINWARHLVIEPSNILTPGKVVEEARKIALDLDLEIEVLDEKKAKQKGMSAFCAIAQGSEEPSYMVSLKYSPNERANKNVLALVGKGVTFDSGGLSIKPSEKMEEMKMDMAGAAAVLATMKIVGELKPKITVVGVTPLTENLPSGKAVKPGDVVRAMNGKTVEIINTDAEGRVVLADAVLYAQEKGATHLVDIATLTGAVIVALGHEVVGVIGRPKEWVEKLVKIALSSGEKMWELPNFDLYKELLKSSIADYANVPSSRQAGTIAGGLFIGEFVKKEIPWVHLDIGGTAWLESEKPYQDKGPTGVGIKTFVNLIKSLEREN